MGVSLPSDPKSANILQLIMEDRPLRSVEMTEIDSFAITGGYPVCCYSMVKVRLSRLAVP